MAKEDSNKENRKTIWISLIIVVVLAIVVVLLYIPKQMGYSNLDCAGLFKENALIIDSYNYCSNDEDCIITSDIIMHMCGCYELINKNSDLIKLEGKKIEIDNLIINKECAVDSCVPCSVPDSSSVKCVNGKCVVE